MERAGNPNAGYVSGNLFLKLEGKGRPRKPKPISLARTSIERKP